jgi:hypothetical protein
MAIANWKGSEWRACPVNTSTNPVFDLHFLGIKKDTFDGDIFEPLPPFWVTVWPNDTVTFDVCFSAQR